MAAAMMRSLGLLAAVLVGNVAAHVRVTCPVGTLCDEDSVASTEFHLAETITQDRKKGFPGFVTIDFPPCPDRRRAERVESFRKGSTCGICFPDLKKHFDGCGEGIVSFAATEDDLDSGMLLDQYEVAIEQELPGGRMYSTCPSLLNGKIVPGRAYVPSLPHSFLAGLASCEVDSVDLPFWLDASCARGDHGGVELSVGGSGAFNFACPYELSLRRRLVSDDSGNENELSSGISDPFS